MLGEYGIALLRQPRGYIVARHTVSPPFLAASGLPPLQAFGSTEAFNDRMAIAANFSRLLSPADTAFCCVGQSQGCDGGFTGAERARERVGRFPRCARPAHYCPPAMRPSPHLAQTRRGSGSRARAS